MFHHRSSTGDGRCGRLVAGERAKLVVMMLCIVVASVTALSANTEGQQQQQQEPVVGLVVIHRHGARLPVAAEGLVNLCGDQCGELTSTGEEMLFQLGQYMQTAYPNVQFGDAAAAPVRGTLYNPKRIVSRSTDVTRTLQSAHAFVKGLLAPSTANATLNRSLANDPAVARIAPAINGVPETEARELLVWASWPALVLHSQITQQAFNAMMAQRLTRLFNASDYYMFGVETGQASVCATDPFDCALVAQDVITCAISNMPLAAVQRQFPFLLATYARLTEVMEIYNAISMYNSSDPFDAAIGTKGFLLASALTQQLASVPATASPANPFFLELSGHDVTLMPFAETVGNNSFINPLFAGAFIIELRGTNVSTRTVHLKYGEPSQRYGSAHRYIGNFYDFGLRCMNSAGFSYTSTTDGCPLADWTRFVANRGPGSPAGICYIPAADLDAIDCTPGGHDDNTVSGAPTNPLCVYYRTQCARWACLAPHFTSEPRYFLDPVSLACVPVGAPGPGAPAGNNHDGFLKSVPPGALIGISVFATLTLVALLIAGYVCCCWQQQGNHDEDMPDGAERDYLAAGPAVGQRGRREEEQAYHHDRRCVCDRLVDRMMRSICCRCCCGERIRRQDQDFFINGTDAGSSCAGGDGRYPPPGGDRRHLQQQQQRIGYQHPQRGARPGADPRNSRLSSPGVAAPSTLPTRCDASSAADGDDAAVVSRPLFNSQGHAPRGAGDVGPVVDDDPAALDRVKQPKLGNLPYTVPLSPERRLSFGPSEV